MAARPKTLWAAAAPVVVGSAMAYSRGPFDWVAAAAALVGGLLLQIGANYANDYFDFVKGADRGDRLGPTRVTQAGLVAPETMRRAVALVFALALVPGAYVVYRGGWPFIAIGLTSILLAILYTAGPYPLGYLGLGDVFVLIFFGPVALCGTYYLHVAALSTDVFIASLAPGLLSVALLTVNNLRDLEEDRRAGKKTLAVRFGRTFARLEYTTCLAAAALIIPTYFFCVTGNPMFAMTPLIVFGYGVAPLKTVFTTTDGPALNRVLARTGQLLLLFAIVFSLSWLV